MHPGRRAVLRAILGFALLFAASCATSPPASPSTSGAVMEVVVATDVAAKLLFRPTEVSAPARTRIRLTFRNVSTQAHNLTFDAPMSGATRTIVEAGGSDAIDFLTPGPGRYSFACTIHMGMTGTLTVK
jgi:plastocyanin